MAPRLLPIGVATLVLCCGLLSPAQAQNAQPPDAASSGLAPSQDPVQDDPRLPEPGDVTPSPGAPSPGPEADEPAAKPTPDDIDRILSFANDAFVYGDYRAVRDILRPVLRPEPMPLATPILIEAWTLDGVSAFFLGERTEADEAFLEILLLDPRLRLDPLLYPAPVISRFDRVREANAERLQPLLGTEDEESIVYIESRVREQPLLVSMMPLGYGFFAMERDVLGVTYLLSQATLGITSASLFLLNESARDSRGFFPEAERAERRQSAQIGTGIAFLGLVALNALHGALLHPRDGLIEYRTLTAPPESRTNEGDRSRRRDTSRRSRR